MIGLPFFSTPDRRSPQPYSRQATEKTSRLRGAAVTESVCPYCAVGCGQLVYTKGGQLIDIEGDPRSPINEGTLCPKGASAFQLAVNAHRVKTVLYRAPFSDHWETKPLDWALDQIARRVKVARDRDFTTQDEKGQRLNSVQHRNPGRRDAGYRRELLYQEAVHRRPWRRLGREPGADILAILLALNLVPLGLLLIEFRRAISDNAVRRSLTAMVAIAVGVGMLIPECLLLAGSGLFPVLGAATGILAGSFLSRSAIVKSAHHGASK